MVIIIIIIRESIIQPYIKHEMDNRYTTHSARRRIRDKIPQDKPHTGQNTTMWKVEKTKQQHVVSLCVQYFIEHKYDKKFLEWVVCICVICVYSGSIVYRLFELNPVV